MRTVRFYRVNDKAWLSPTRYLSAVISGDQVTAVDHGETTGAMRAVAILRASATVVSLLRASLWGTFSGLLYSVALLFLLFYPPLMTAIHPGIQGVCTILTLCAGLMSIHNIIKIIINRISFLWKEKKLKLNVRSGPHLDPPLIAHKQMTPKKPSMVLPMMVLVVAIVLNSIVLATPLRPAIMGDAIYEKPRLVLPGTEWKAVQRYPDAVAFHYFYYDGSSLWGVYISYSVEQLDLLSPTPKFRSWMQSYVYSIVSHASNQVAVTFAPDMSDDERRQAYIDFWSDPNNIDQLTTILTSSFNSVYDKVLQMRGIHISVRCISVSEYRNIAKDNDE